MPIKTSNPDSCFNSGFQQCKISNVTISCLMQLFDDGSSTCLDASC